MDRLNEKMELLDEKIQNKAAKAGEDYLSFFESHAEEAYKEYYLYKCFRDLRQKARESGSPEKVLEYLKKKTLGVLPGSRHGNLPVGSLRGARRRILRGTGGSKGGRR